MRIRPRVASLAALGVVAATLLAAGAPAGAATNPPRRIVSAWLPYWTASASTASAVANKDLFTDASPFWFTASSATTITAQLDVATRQTVTDQLHAAGIPVFPSVTDSLPAHGMAAVLADPATRLQHVNALLATVIAGGYDGIDLDYEKFAFSDGSSTWAATRPSWVAFVTQLSAALHARGKKLSVTTPYMTAPTTGYWVYDWLHIGPYVDRLRIMTYDYSTSRAGPIAPISWVTAVAAFAVTQLPASKVWIGVPTYGYDWPSSTTGCPVDNMPVRQSHTATAAAALAVSLGRTTTWNATYGERTFTYLKTYSGHTATGAAASCTVTRTVWYDDRSSVLLRAHLVGTYHLGGIALWTVGGEDVGQWSLLRSYAQTIAPDVSFTRASTSVPKVAYGQAVTVYGLVTRGNGGTPIVGATVQMQAQRTGASTWNTLLTGTTSDTGAVQFSHVPTGATNYRLLTLSAFDHTADYSPVVTVAVTRAITLAATPTTLVHGGTFTLSGVVRPNAGGIRVYVQRWNGTGYTTVASVLAAPGGVFSYPVRTTTAGSYGYRVFVYGDATYGAFTTGRVTVTAT